MSAARKTQRRTAIIQKRALELGALHAKKVSPRQVFTAPWVRMKCQYGCEGYGSSRTCPPFTPTPEQTRKILDCYRKAVLVHGDRTTNIRKIVTTLEREAFLAGFYKAFGFGSGPCNLCKKCAVEAGCRRAGEARPAMEACGIDVYRTARVAGLPIEVVLNEDSEQNYYGLLLLE